LFFNKGVKYLENDLLTILVNLYGSKEQFVNEYQSMLALKMIGVQNFNIEQEIKILEVLKLRYGEQNFQSCNIIVKDVKDSKRTDNLIHINSGQSLVHKQAQMLQFS